MAEVTSSARCVSCRSDVAVPDSYATGDHIKCGVCGTQHKVQRGEVLRLVLADIEPIRHSLRETERRIHGLTSELTRARGSLGIGANGFGIGLIYVIYEIALKDQPLTSSLGRDGVIVAIVTGILLEVANFLFLAKRSQITRLNAEIEQLREEGRDLQQKIREASRV